MFIQSLDISLSDDNFSSKYTYKTFLKIPNIPLVAQDKGTNTIL